MLTVLRSSGYFFAFRRFIILVLFPVTIITGCKVQLVPTYSAELEKQIVEGAKMTDMLYLEMLDAPADKKTYTLYAEKYRVIEGEINSILLKNETRPKAATDIVASVTKLRDAFVNARNEHKTKGALTDPEIIIFRETFKGFWKPVLIEERVLDQ